MNKKTFIVNTNHPLAKKLSKINAKDETLCETIVKEMYDLCLLSQKEMDPDYFTTFLQSTTSLIEELTNRIK